MAAGRTHRIPAIIPIADRQEPYTKKASRVTRNVGDFSGKKSEEWTISSEMTRQKGQED